MPIYRVHSVSRLEDPLKLRFDKLIHELSGNRISAQQAKSDHFDVHEDEEDSEFYRINQLDLRLAIEDFNAILKELKKFAGK